MVLRFYLLLFLGMGFTVFAQVDSRHYVTKKIAVSDTIYYSKVSTNPYYFKVLAVDGTNLDSTKYLVDFAHSKLVLLPEFHRVYSQIDSLYIHFYKYPDFITQEYIGYDIKLIMPENTKLPPIVDLHTKKYSKEPFSGLDTQGNIIRGITIGNNQDAVLNSVLDLKIEGKLTSKISLRARINDTNIPIQENGYSQDLKDLDRVYIEMQAPQWNIKAGDIILQNQGTDYINFTKKVSGVSLSAKIDSTSFFTSGALVKGRFTTYKFQGKEANQGPYKLKGQTGESYIFIINKSEKVYINGILQDRGKDKDYWIDYNTAELFFTATNPITSDMRIRIEFQYSDRNYTRFVTHNTIQYRGKKLQIGGYFYNESDFKNQPIQLQLTEEQKELLAILGDSETGILVPQIVETEFTENLLLYRKLNVGTQEIFEYSTDPNEILYQVGFTYVGNNQGNYEVLEYLATGRKMGYVGESQGDYVAAIPLVAPSKQQLFVINTEYQVLKKTHISTEIAYSNKDSNLFSSIDNRENKAPAMKFRWQQVLLDSTAQHWQLESNFQLEYLDRNFKSIERIQAVEFDRDWNLSNTTGNQRLLKAQLSLEKTDKKALSYTFENLNFSSGYNGNRHRFMANLQWKDYYLQQRSSFLKSEKDIVKTTFSRSFTNLKYVRHKWWFGTQFDYESNLKRDKLTDTLNQPSYRFLDLRARLGVGDSTKIFTSIGATYHTNDSLRNNLLQQTNNSKTIFVNSQLLKKQNSELQLYANYRTLSYKNGLQIDAFNSRLNYKQQLFSRFVYFQMNYQTLSGSVPQQEFTYIVTEPGHGYYTWIDYNNNGLQELDEFEIAQFADQANYLRIALPNIQYIPTQEAKIQQSFQLDFKQWKSQTGFKKVLSHWSNHLQILAKNNRTRIQNSLYLNPFNFSGSSLLSLQYNLRNSLYYNKGQAHYSLSYFYTDSHQKTIHLFDAQDNKLNKNQLLFTHNINRQWQIDFEVNKSKNSSQNITFTSRNYNIQEIRIIPEIRYTFSKSHWIKTGYSYVEKDNSLGDLEHLQQQQLHLEYSYSEGQKTRFLVKLKALKNDFSGVGFSVVGYQMLEGLQTGKNMVWNLLWSTRLNSYLYLNLNYNGRSNSDSGTIHNGNIELRANF